MAPQTFTLDVLWLQEEGAQIHVSVQRIWAEVFPLLYTGYTADCVTALLGEDISSGYYVQ